MRLLPTQQFSNVTIAALWEIIELEWQGMGSPVHLSTAEAEKLTDAAMSLFWFARTRPAEIARDDIRTRTIAILVECGSIAFLDRRMFH